MLSDAQITQIKQKIFPKNDNYLYAVIDGASCPELRFKIYDWEPESSCLWSGDLEPDLEEVAPYMVQLEPNSAFTDWLIKEGWGNHWNIFVESPLDPKAFRKQIRKLLLVRSPEGKSLVFRFYDPRVMDIFVPTCDEEQLEELFEGLSFIYLQSVDSGDFKKFSFDGQALISVSLDIADLV